MSSPPILRAEIPKIAMAQPKSVPGRKPLIKCDYGVKSKIDFDQNDLRKKLRCPQEKKFPTMDFMENPIQGRIFFLRTPQFFA